ncbi:unnamed protein product, partial [Ectocarpus sp. 12 AP-2014]
LAREGKRRRQRQRSVAPPTTEKPVESRVGVGTAAADKLADKVAAVAPEPSE